MGDITSETTTSKSILEQQKAILDRIVRGDSDRDDLMRELIKAVKEITTR